MLQPVTALVFADGGRLLLSGGEDALAHAWLLLDVLDADLPADRCPTGARGVGSLLAPLLPGRHTGQLAASARPAALTPLAWHSILKRLTFVGVPCGRPWCCDSHTVCSRLMYVLSSSL